jgi:Transcription elongation factor, GreA/GreB, C-term
MRPTITLSGTGRTETRSPSPNAAGDPSRRWPMTSAAWSRLIDEVATLQRDVVMVASEVVWEPGVIHVPAAQLARRLTTLRIVLERAERVDDPGSVVIGRRATVVEEDGERSSYALVFPGDGDPRRRSVSPESPIGAALLGARCGETVVVDAPAGRRTLTIEAVE